MPGWCYRCCPFVGLLSHLIESRIATVSSSMALSQTWRFKLMSKMPFCNSLPYIYMGSERSCHAWHAGCEHAIHGKLVILAVCAEICLSFPFGCPNRNIFTHNYREPRDYLHPITSPALSRVSSGVFQLGFIWTVVLCTYATLVISLKSIEASV